MSGQYNTYGSPYQSQQRQSQYGQPQQRQSQYGQPQQRQSQKRQNSTSDI